MARRSDQRKPASAYRHFPRRQLDRFKSASGDDDKFPIPDVIDSSGVNGA